MDPNEPSPEEAPARTQRPPWLLPAAVAAAVVVAVGVGAVGGLLAGSSGETTVVEPSPSPVVVRETVEVEVDPSEERLAELDERERAVDEREAELDERQAALDEREQELDAIEEEAEAGTIPGDGIWTVPDQVQPGIYRAQGSGSSCYWARLRSLDGSDIITNHFGSANVTVEVHASDAAFETAGCGSWRRL